MIKKLLQNPLLHFLILGVSCYLVYKQLLPKEKDTLVVTTQIVEALIKAEQELRPGELTEEMKEELIQNYIDDEVLLREAYKKDLYKKDYQVRKQLLNLMRSALTDVVPEPSYAQLRAYFDENMNRFRSSNSFSYEMVFFAYNSKQVPTNPEAFLEILETSSNPLKLSEYTMMGNTFKKNTYQSIAMRNGKTFTDSLVNAPIHQWLGPIQATQGIQYYRLLAAHEPYTPSFDDVYEYIKDDYYLNKAREIQQTKIKEFRDKYSIEIAL